MTRSFKEINKAIAWQLKESIGEDRFDMWFSCKDAIAIDDGQVIVSAVDDFSLSFVRQQFGNALGDAVQAALGPGHTLNFVIAQSGQKTQHNLFTAEELDSAGQPLALAGRPASSTTASANSAPKQNPAANRRRRRPVDDRQLSFVEPGKEQTASFKPTYRSIESFYFGKQNLLLETAVKEMLAEPGKYNPLVIHGPVGCGKSHLAQAIVARARETRRFRRCVNVTSEQFTSGFIDALQTKQLTGFRSKYRNLDLLAIDDIQFLAGKQATIVEFQNTIEALIRNGKQILVTSDKPLFDLNFTCDQLITRLSCGLTCPVAYPDLEGRISIVRGIAATRDLKIDRQTERMVCERMGRDVRLLSGAVNRLKTASIAMKKTIDLESAGELLADMSHSQSPLLSLSRIEKVVCDLCGVEPDELKSSKRIKRVSTARMLAMWLSRKYTSAGLAEIGKYYGDRSHSTVVAAEKKISGLIETDAAIELKTRRSTIAATVDRLKSSLEVG